MKNKVMLILQREYFSRIKKRSFITMSLLGPLLISLFAVLAIQVSESFKQYQVLVVDPYAISNGTFTDSQWCTYTYSETDITDAQFQKSNYDVLVYINEKFATNNSIDAYYKERPNPYARAEIIRQLEYRLERLKLQIHNINEEAYAHIKQRVVLNDHLIGGKQVAFKDNAGNVGYVFGLLIFLFIFNFGVQVFKGVLEEKSNRIVEVLISSVKPVQLMAGKIAGIGLAALTQFTIWTLLTAVIMIGIKDYVYPDQFDPAAQTVESTANSKMPYQQAESIEINEVASLIYDAVNYPGMLMFFIVFLLLGFLFYAAIFAAIGAAVDNETDGQQFLVPVTLPLLFSFVIAWLAVAEPGNSLVALFSQIPFTSPIVMMVRLPLLEPNEFWQVYVSIGILIASVLIMLFVSARIYRTGILMYGKKPKLGELIRWALRG